MPSANPIRKEILQALDHSIIPALWREGVPLEFPAGITARLIDKTVPRANREDVAFPLQTCWPRANLHSSFYPYFGFLYEGVADERTLITEAQATKFKLAKGVYALRWHAPGVLLFPSGAARSGAQRRCSHFLGRASASAADENFVDELGRGIADAHACQSAFSTYLRSFRDVLCTESTYRGG